MPHLQSMMAHRPTRALHRTPASRRKDRAGLIDAASDRIELTPTRSDFGMRHIVFRPQRTLDRSDRIRFPVSSILASAS
jgi:hypothetical protein